ncbi:MAG: hypothetical protein MZU97_27040 [Bacillus subtilis]|nr:hypothetical protein [Bacillus subtilis]
MTRTADELLQRAEEAGVAGILNPGYDLRSSDSRDWRWRHAIEARQGRGGHPSPEGRGA